MAEGRELERANQPEAALARYEAAIDADEDFFAAYEAAAPLWIRLDRLDALIARFERVTLRHPRYATGWYHLAFAYRKTGRLRIAVDAYRHYIALRPLDADPHYGLAVALARLGDRDAARRAFTRYLAMETRPERQRFVDHARAELEALGGPLDPVASPAPWRTRSRATLLRLLAAAHDRLGDRTRAEELRRRAATAPGPAR